MGSPPPWFASSLSTALASWWEPERGRVVNDISKAVSERVEAVDQRVRVLEAEREKERAAWIEKEEEIDRRLDSLEDERLDEFEKLERQSASFEDRDRRWNIIFHGVGRPERGKERQHIVQWVNRELEGFSITTDDLVNAHPLYYVNYNDRSAAPAPMIARFYSLELKEAIRTKAARCAPMGTRLTDNYSARTRRARFQLFPFFLRWKEEKAAHEKVTLATNRVTRGRRYLKYHEKRNLVEEWDGDRFVQWHAPLAEEKGDGKSRDRDRMAPSPLFGASAPVGNGGQPEGPRALPNVAMTTSGPPPPVNQTATPPGNNHPAASNTNAAAVAVGNAAASAPATGLVPDHDKLPADKEDHPDFGMGSDGNEVPTSASTNNDAAEPRRGKKRGGGQQDEQRSKSPRTRSLSSSRQQPGDIENLRRWAMDSSVRGRGSTGNRGTRKSGGAGRGRGIPAPPQPPPPSTPGRGAVAAQVDAIEKRNGTGTPTPPDLEMHSVD